MAARSTVMDFQVPKITHEEVKEHRGVFVIEPLDRGFGHTFGNSLRRVLLSSLEGAAVTAAPSSEESSTRRSEFPKVCPKPRSSGSMTKTPRFSSASSWTILGIWNSIRLVRVAKTILSAVRTEPGGAGAYFE